MACWFPESTRHQAGRNSHCDCTHVVLLQLASGISHRGPAAQDHHFRGSRDLCWTPAPCRPMTRPKGPHIVCSPWDGCRIPGTVTLALGGRGRASPVTVLWLRARGPSQDGDVRARHGPGFNQRQDKGSASIARGACVPAGQLLYQPDGCWTQRGEREAASLGKGDSEPGSTGLCGFVSDLSNNPVITMPNSGCADPAHGASRKMGTGATEAMPPLAAKLLRRWHEPATLPRPSAFGGQNGNVSGLAGRNRQY